MGFWYFIDQTEFIFANSLIKSSNKDVDSSPNSFFVKKLSFYLLNKR